MVSEKKHFEGRRSPSPCFLARVFDNWVISDMGLIDDLRAFVFVLFHLRVALDQAEDLGVLEVLGLARLIKDLEDNCPSSGFPGAGTLLQWRPRRSAGGTGPLMEADLRQGDHRLL